MKLTVQLSAVYPYIVKVLANPTHFSRNWQVLPLICPLCWQVLFPGMLTQATLAWYPQLHSPSGYHGLPRSSTVTSRDMPSCGGSETVLVKPSRWKAPRLTRCCWMIWPLARAIPSRLLRRPSYRSCLSARSRTLPCLLIQVSLFLSNVDVCFSIISMMNIKFKIK